MTGSGSALEGRRILVVEDEMLIALELKTVLERLGCVVLGPVPTVTRATAALGQDRPDAALLDLNLRGEPATPVAAALRAAKVPFVIVSGYSNGRSREPELQGAPRMEKPVNHSDLEEALIGVLRDGSA